MLLQYTFMVPPIIPFTIIHNHTTHNIRVYSRKVVVASGQLLAAITTISVNVTSFVLGGGASSGRRRAVIPVHSA